ncbi:phage portal protein [Lysinibacillus sphaericus]|uniref:phage portal protein n=1 Tax=Lysinibacillus sphaericus TaxID=1421 RepID=UPI001A9EB389|nr:phage portal protein [Lysinibacillus sphaericus]QTB25213.1 phage portal protein [Lysinibacillus sphaericus]
MNVNLLNRKVTIAERMRVFQPYIEYIDQFGFNETLIPKLIADHKSIKQDVHLLQKRYEVSTDGVPILTRSPVPLDLENDKVRRIDALVNNKVNTAFDADIVDTKVGYMYGIPVNYTVEGVRDEPRLQPLATEIDNFRVRNAVADKDASLGKQTDIAGYGARLAYVALENNKPVLRIMNVDTDEVIFLFEETIAEPKYSMRYYDTFVLDQQANKQNVTKVEFYDANTIWYFDNLNGTFELTGYQEHGFMYNPLFGMENNDEMQGAAMRIMNLIDAYDRALSDASSEVESMRLALLILHNIGLQPEEIQQMQKSGALEIWGPDAKVSFLTKNVNDSMIEHLLERLEKNIMRIGKSVDFTCEEFASNLSGIAILMKTMALEHKAGTTEQKNRTTLQYQFKVLCSGWARLGYCQPEDYLKVWFEFKRNLPKNLLEAAQTSQALKGYVSEDTRLSLLPFVDDVAAERLAMEEDSKIYGSNLGPLNEDDDDDDPKEVDDS